MEQFLNLIADYLKKQNKHIVRISGHGAAGKTTCSEAVMNRLESNTYNYLNTDAYIIKGDYRKSLEAIYEYENEVHRGKATACLPAAHELESLKRDLLMLQKGMDFLSIDAHWAPEKMIYAERPVTIVDGMSTTFVDASLFDLSIYIYTDEQTELDRRMERDVKSRGKSSEALIRSHHQRRIQYEIFMHGRREEFDIIINNSNNQFAIEKNTIIGI